MDRCLSSFSPGALFLGIDLAKELDRMAAIQQHLSSRVRPSPAQHNGSLMRDIRADLQDRAHSVAYQISAEDARFENLVLQLRTEQDSKLEHLKALLRLANKLLEFTFLAR
jgi:hypothetical protein